jgi:hypothetical protein
VKQADEDRTVVRNQFQWSIQALAMDAEVQRSLFPTFVCKADELALDYSDWSRVARSLFASEWSGDQLKALGAIDIRLDAMSRGGSEFDEELWSEDALTSRPQWDELRSLARAALVQLGWSVEAPPFGRSAYVPGRSSDV